MGLTLILAERSGDSTREIASTTDRTVLQAAAQAVLRDAWNEHIRHRSSDPARAEERLDAHRQLVATLGRLMPLAEQTVPSAPGGIRSGGPI